MTHRQIILDTETTGIRVEDGHRLIEMGCLEMINRKLTGKYYQSYINHDREVEAGAYAVHGISTEFLRDKPVFSQIVDDFLKFISNAELIIHNAPFDLSFIDHELSLTHRRGKKMSDDCRIIDTLKMARQLHIGQRNSLDALCKRYNIDNSKREWHGALLDANLLARVYLAMTGGQGNFFDALNETPLNQQNDGNTPVVSFARKYQLTVLKATPEEMLEHRKYLQSMRKQDQSTWEDDTLDDITK